MTHVWVNKLPSFAQIMAWNLRTLRTNLKRNTCIFIQENASKNVVWKMTAILSRLQWVKRIPQISRITGYIGGTLQWILYLTSRGLISVFIMFYLYLSLMVVLCFFILIQWFVVFTYNKTSMMILIIKKKSIYHNSNQSSLKIYTNEVYMTASN